jgi:tetratricopeptide (TPR) repeat protein
MKEDFNPNPPARPADDPEGPLQKAFEELLEGLSHHDRPTAAASDPPEACPEPGEWVRLASGEALPAELDALLAHAAGCGNCADRLRASLRLFSSPPSAEETAAAGELASATPFWQRRMAVELARTPMKPTRARAARIYLWTGAGVAASLALALGLTVWWQQVHTPERLLAEAYTHSRSFDLRMPEAGFADVTPQAHLRGGANGRESSRLLDARSRIERQLENAPENAHWLQLEARADVLEEKFDPAIDILDRLLAAGPVTPGLLADDATAYFQRGIAANSENDRATALDDLRRADELAPGDPVVLFNEAVVMEDRGQVMNAVETWNRYLRFERDPRWLAEGRRRLDTLEQKLNQLKTHSSRMEQHLSTPQAMRDLSAGLDSGRADLAGLDEEFSGNLLPRLLDAAFPLPVVRSRGSPCGESCQSARTLLHSLAASLERNHQDPWLTQLLPAEPASPRGDYLQAIHALSEAIRRDASGDDAGGKPWALKARQLFHNLGNAAGEDRATVEQAYERQVLSDLSGCYRVVHPLVGRDPEFAWIQIHVLTEDAQCDPAPGTGQENNPAFQRVVSLAQDRHYALLELRARNLLGAAAVDSGDVESTWRIYLGTVRKFLSGDFPAVRLYTTLSGLEEVEESTPRVQLALLLQREALGALELSQNRELIPPERLHLAAVALRAGALPAAQEQMRLAQDELAANGGGKSVRGFLTENEETMASLYLDRGDLSSAARELDAAAGHMAGESNSFHRREYALNRGRLELAMGHPQTAESLLRGAILDEERLSGKGGAENITLAQQDRDLYAVLAGVWLAQGRSGEDTLALWERYRLRVLGKAVPACSDKGLTCLKPALTGTLGRLRQDQVLGQIVLSDRVLLYRATLDGVVWTSVPIRKEDLLGASTALERAASSPATSQDSVDWAARRVGGILLAGLTEPAAGGAQLLLEPDPLLGNLPWPAVETASGAIGLHFDLEETPSLLLETQPGRAQSGELASHRPLPGAGAPLVVGASFNSGRSVPLPEVLDEARAVARFGRNPSLLLAGQATEPQVAARLTTATAFHFAGHATQQDGATRLLLAPATVGSAGAMGDAPFLDSDLLRRHPPRAVRLAVFSSCASGKREEGWNHGMGDIVDTLASLGVPQVVATRWQIDSASAVPMMDAFYGDLANGLNVPRALTRARQSLVSDPRYRHPYYWAAYYASGTGNTDLSRVFQPAR